MGSSPDVPEPPSPDETARAQIAANDAALESSIAANTWAEIGPAGTVSWQLDGNGNPLARVTELTEPGQLAYDNQQWAGAVMSDLALQRTNSLPSDTFAINAPYSPHDYRDPLIDPWSITPQQQSRLRDNYRERGMLTNMYNGVDANYDPGGYGSQILQGYNQENQGALRDQAAAGGLTPELYQAANAPNDPRFYGDDRLTQVYQAANAPFDPTRSEVASRSYRIGQASGQGVTDGQGRYDATADMAGQGAAANQLGAEQLSEAQAFQRTGRENPYNPAEYGDLNTYRDDVSSAFFDRQNSLMTPSFEQDRSDLEQDLANRGIPVGSDAYNRALGNFEREKNASRERLANQAVLAGGAESERQLGMELGLNDQAYSQGRDIFNAGQDARAFALGAQGQGFNQGLEANRSAFGMSQDLANNRIFGLQAQQGFEQDARAIARGESIQDQTLSNADRNTLMNQQQALRGAARNETFEDWQRGNAGRQERVAFDQGLIDLQRGRNIEDLTTGNATIGQEIGLQQGLRGTQRAEGIQDFDLTNQAMLNRIAQEQGLMDTQRGRLLQDQQQRVSDTGNRVQFEQNLRNQAISDQLMQRNQNINEMAALTQGAPAISMPTAQAAPNYSTTAPNIGALNAQEYNAAANNAAIAAQSQNNLISGAFGLAGAALPFAFGPAAGAAGAAGTIGNVFGSPFGL